MKQKYKSGGRSQGRPSAFDAGKPLTNARHERFAQLLAEGRSADAAYVGAGYRPHKSNPARLSGNERIRGRVAAIQTEGAERAAVTVERVVGELAKVAFASIGAVVERWDADGVRLRNSDDVRDDDKAAVSEVSESHLRGERTVRVKMHSKLDALDKLGKYLGMFRERHELSGPDGQPIALSTPPTHYAGIEIDTATPEQLTLMQKLRELELQQIAAGRRAAAT